MGVDGKLTIVQCAELGLQDLDLLGLVRPDLCLGLLDIKRLLLGQDHSLPSLLLHPEAVDGLLLSGPLLFHRLNHVRLLGLHLGLRLLLLCRNLCGIPILNHLRAQKHVSGGRGLASKVRDMELRLFLSTDWLCAHVGAEGQQTLIFPSQSSPFAAAAAAAPEAVCCAVLDSRTALPPPLLLPTVAAASTRHATETPTAARRIPAVRAGRCGPSPEASAMPGCPDLETQSSFESYARKF